MKKFLIAAAAISVLASAGAASAQSYQRGYDQRGSQYQSYDRYDRGDRYDRSDRYDRNERYDARGHGRYDNRGHHYGQQHRYRRGDRLPSAYRSRAYAVDYRHYGLRAPPYGYQYSRVDSGQIILAAIATGLIASIISGGY